MKETPSNYNRIGMTLGQIGRYPAAIEAFRKALELKPDFAPAHHNLGLAYANLDRLEDAADAYRAALGADPRNVASYCGLGHVLARLDRHAEALDVLARGRLRVPASHEIAYGYGVACENLMRWEEAAECYRRSVELNPFLPEPYLALARLSLYVHGRPDEAVAALSAAAELDPANPEVRRALDDALALLVR